MDVKNFTEIKAVIDRFIRSMVSVDGFVKQIDVQAVSAVSGMEAILNRGRKTTLSFQAFVLLASSYPEPLPEKIENKIYAFKVTFIFQREPKPLVAMTQKLL